VQFRQVSKHLLAPAAAAANKKAPSTCSKNKRRAKTNGKANHQSLAAPAASTFFRAPFLASRSKENSVISTINYGSINLYGSPRPQSIAAERYGYRTSFHPYRNCSYLLSLFGVVNVGSLAVRLKQS
jgi:hypothetical protein